MLFRHSKWWWIASAALASVALLFVTIGAYRGRPVPFPDDADVVVVTASLTGDGWGPKAIPEFQVPPSLVPRLLSLFRPARRENYPKMWDESRIATLKIKTRSGKVLPLFFGFSGKNPLCYNFAGIRCVRGGLYASTYVSEEGVYEAECVVVEALICEIHRVMAAGEPSKDREELFERLERSAGKRPPLPG